MSEMVKEMDKYKVDIRALQEIRWPWKGTVIKKGDENFVSKCGKQLVLK
jgi:hypothetical protein